MEKIISINRNNFEHYICSSEVAWQVPNGYIKISHDKESSDFEELCTLLGSACEELSVVNRLNLLNTSFHKLAEWSTSDDVLLSAGNDLLLCVPKFEFEKLMVQ